MVNGDVDVGNAVIRYPFIPLPKAIERARDLHQMASRSAAPMPTLLQRWGYGPKSSGGIQTVAALKSFGLISDEGSGDARKLKLTEAAIRILLLPSEESRATLIKDCALRPRIHREVWQHFNGQPPPSRELFRAYLLLDRRMAQRAVDDLEQEFYATMEFAKLDVPALDSSSEDIEAVGQAELDVQAGVDPAPLRLYQQPGVTVMAGERVVFTEENAPQQYVKLIAAGEIDDILLDALDAFVDRQRRRLERASKTPTGRAHEPGTASSGTN